MKRYNLGDANNYVLRQLCGYFRIDARDLSYSEKVAMLYIYRTLTAKQPTPDVSFVIGEIDRLRVSLKIRGRRRSLYPVYSVCQAQSFRTSGLYAPTSAHPVSGVRRLKYY